MTIAIITKNDNVTGADFMATLEAHPAVTALKIHRIPMTSLFNVKAVEEGADWTEEGTVHFEARLSFQGMGELQDTLNKDPRASVDFRSSAMTGSLYVNWNSQLLGRIVTVTPPAEISSMSTEGAVSLLTGKVY